MHGPSPGSRDRTRLRWRIPALLLLPALAAADKCTDKVKIPDTPPDTAITYNGIRLPDICFMKPGPYNVYAIGDWGGLMYGEHMPPVPADKRSKLFPRFRRKFMLGTDDRAQLKVAAEMRVRASFASPDYILNVGDNFYWGGVNGKCGQAPYQQNASAQWLHVFEQVYWGPGLDDKPWFGVLGNHDFGGYKMTSAWENVVGYSWGGGNGNTRRWVNPALYYSQQVNYPSFSVLYLFVDTNAFETWPPEENPYHNICGKLHNAENATCKGGPSSIWTCESWFHRIMDQEWQWIEDSLRDSSSTYQVVVTHFPPQWGKDHWSCLVERYGIDVFISGHIHKQQMWSGDEDGNDLPGTCTIITGGGGGITAEDVPKEDGDDDSYGFMHLTLSSQKITVEGITHSGIIRKVMVCGNRGPVPGDACQPRRLEALEPPPISPLNTFV